MSRNSTGANGLPGPENEPCIPVKAGRTFLLSIGSDSARAIWQVYTPGFTLNMRGTTASFIDNTPPQLWTADDTLSCNSDTLTFEFDEFILDTTLTLNMLALQGPGGMQQLLSLSSTLITGCGYKKQRERNYKLRVSPPFTQSGAYTLRLKPNSGLTDLCGNVNTAGDSLVFHLQLRPPSAGRDSSLRRCISDSALSLAPFIAGRPDPGGWWSGPAGRLVADRFEPGADPPGPYVYHVGGQGCPADSAVISVYVDRLPDAGANARDTLCAYPSPVPMRGLLAGAPQPGGDWLDPMGLPTDSMFTPGLDPPGRYVYIKTGGACGGAAAATLQISVAPLPALSAQTQAARCHGEASGRAFLSAAGGTPPYRYELNALAQNSPAFVGLPAGPYSAAVTDAMGCRSQQSLNITQPPALRAALALRADPACHGDSSGRIVAAATGGAPAYHFALNGMSSVGALYSRLPAGSYHLAVRDDSLCRDTLRFVLAAPPPLVVSAARIQHLLCHGDNSGSVTLAAAGGAGAWRYALPGAPPSGNPLFSGLAAGAHHFVAHDDSACTDTLHVVLQEPPPLRLDTLATQGVDCFGNANGYAVLRAAGGTPPWLFARDSLNFQPGDTLRALSATLYRGYVRDGNGCTARTAPFIIKSPSSLWSALDSMSPLRCHGDSSGYMRFMGQGGTPPYAYSLDGLRFRAQAGFDSLRAGFYPALTRDANGCRAAYHFSLQEPPPLRLTLLQQLHNPCHGDSLGRLSLRASGGTLPRFFSIGGAFQADSLFQGLPAGNFGLVLRDANACRDSIRTQILQPDSIEFQAMLIQEPRCYGEAGGALRLRAAGGVSPYAFSIDGQLFQPDTLFAALKAGEWKAHVSDANGCRDSLSLRIGQPDSLQWTQLRLREPACHGARNGWISAALAGGVGPYQYSLNHGSFQPLSRFDSLAAGQYWLRATDQNQCLDSLLFTLNAPPALSLVLAGIRAVDCYGFSNGKAELRAVGGSPAYRYALNGAWRTTPVWDSLTAGLYSAWVQDDSLCRDTLWFTVPQPDSLRAGLRQRDVACFGEASGEAVLEPGGGTPPYAVYWPHSLPAQGLQVRALRAGRYAYRLTDGNGCSLQDSFLISEPPALRLDIEELSPSYCALPNGGFRAEASGGTAPLRLLWGNGLNQTGFVSGAIFGGDVPLSLRDGLGCRLDSLLHIPVLPPPSCDFSILPDPGAQLLLSQADVFFPNESVHTVAYQWDFGDGAGSSLQHPQHRYTEPGAYTISLTAYDSLFVCPCSTSREIVIVPDGALYLPNAFSPNGDGINDLLIFPGEGIRQMKLNIFDRWGRVVFHSTQPAAAWDGRSPGGAALPEGVYTFLIEGVFNNGRPFRQAGSITLLR